MGRFSLLYFDKISRLRSNGYKRAWTEQLILHLSSDESLITQTWWNVLSLPHTIQPFTRLATDFIPLSVSNYVRSKTSIYLQQNRDLSNDDVTKRYDNNMPTGTACSQPKGVNMWQRKLQFVYGLR